MNGHVHVYQYTVLPFGLAPASYVFTKVLRQLVKNWRGQCVKTIIFLNDAIAGHRDWESTNTVKIRWIIRNTLTTLIFANINFRERSK